MLAQLLSYQCPYCGHLTEVDPGEGDKTVTCPNKVCGKPFHPEIPTVKPVPTLIVPPSVHADEAAGPTLQDRLSALTEKATAADEPKPAADTAEHEVLTIHPVMFRRYPFRCIAYTVTAFAGVVSLLYGLVHGYHALTVLGVVLLGFAGYRLLSWWVRNRATWVKVTSKRIVLHAGALESHRTEVAYKDVTDIQAHQNLFNRMLDVGDLTLFTKLDGKREILVMAVSNPEDVASRMRKLRQP